MLTSHSAYFLEGKNLASFGLMKTTHLRIHPCGLSAPDDLKPPPISLRLVLCALRSPLRSAKWFAPQPARAPLLCFFSLPLRDFGAFAEGTYLPAQARLQRAT